MTSENGSQAVDRALALLHLFTGPTPSWTLTELAREAGLTVSTTHRILKSLLAKEFVTVDPRTRRYSVGVEVMRLASTVLENDATHRLQMVAQEPMERLRAASKETVGLHVRIGRSRVCVSELSSPHPIRMATTIGGVQPLHAGAASKALLAWLPAAEWRDLLRDQPLDRLTPLTITALDALDAELAEVRQRGYATSYGESVAGAAALAAPIFGLQGRPMAALNVTGPLERFDRSAIAATVADLRTASAEISAQLGHVAR
ncbi:IclR family transcriptional regulator [Micromonospora cathayae]|uniref:IclR family transcriptional regulator n=1 Tax=Micromonospora cathayae TaxID=3028804 RepID=A0ABY7ZMS7_9ACTN|nr:IclR family transcriptional regulator [Micromonospora sp. HUAS 3]WDZ83808.1 IclR family transcriptional regulator [Micromonospora sp. HUAS 3]